jgi:hypothetical protein
MKKQVFALDASLMVVAICLLGSLRRRSGYEYCGTDSLNSDIELVAQTVFRTPDNNVVFGIRDLFATGSINRHVKDHFIVVLIVEVLLE